MNTLYQQIIDALRAELNEYGGLLHLFQEQQQFVLRHDPAGFLSLTEGVEEQIQRSIEKRVAREKIVRETASQEGVSPETPLSALLPYCPATFRPLLSALIEEINDLLGRTQRRLRQNHMLLGQCLDLARQMVGMSRPELTTNTYNYRGQRAQASACHSLSGVVA